MAWFSPLSFGSLQTTFWYWEHYPIGVKALGRHQLGFSMFSRLYRCCLQLQVLCPLFVESSLQLWQELGLLGGSHETFLANDSIRCNPLSVLETSFGDKRLCPPRPLTPFLVILFKDIPKHNKGSLQQACSQYKNAEKLKAVTLKSGTRQSYLSLVSHFSSIWS